MESPRTDDVFSNGPAADNFGVVISQPPEIPEIKFRVPSAPWLAKENIARILLPYEYAIQQVQAMLLMRKPREFVVVVMLIEVVFIVLYQLNSGVLSDVCVIISALMLCALVFGQNREYLMENVFTPVEDLGRPGEPNRIYSIDELADLISIVGSRVHCFVLGCQQKASDRTVVGQMLWMFFLLCCFVAAAILRARMVLWFLVNMVLFLPGIVFHPAVYPSIAPFLNTVMVTIAPKVKDGH